jgi:hypothetical protein
MADLAGRCEITIQKTLMVYRLTIIGAIMNKMDFKWNNIEREARDEQKRYREEWLFEKYNALHEREFYRAMEAYWRCVELIALARQNRGFRKIIIESISRARRWYKEYSDMF